MLVGVDYRVEDRTGIEGTVPPLYHAQSDAGAVHDLLVGKFGFDKETTKLLVGGGAKRGAIEEEIGKLANGRQVGENDCVLVYFSGHGVLQRVSADNSQRGYLLPVDVKWVDGQPNPGSAVKMSDVVQYLADCPARHKLLILDCCHAGAVFRLDGVSNPGRFGESPASEDVFTLSGFQAIAASRENQKASDGRNGHSPFTNALLESLQTIPLRNERSLGRRHFTADQLFRTMAPYLKGERFGLPQAGWLGENRGEFHFIPAENAVFSDGKLDEKDRNTLLALTPTTFGNWWAYEVPWFMPGLRLAILQQDVPSRSTVEELDRDSLLIAARRARELAREREQASKNNADPLFAMRYRHLEELLSARERKTQQETMRKIVLELKSPKDGLVLKAEDSHYLAVLHHLLGETEQAAAEYDRALNLYRPDGTAPEKSAGALEALCLLDAGMLSASRNELEEARSRIREAQKRVEGVAPKPFQIFALSREADVCRREGRFGMSAARMDEAINLLTRWDPNETTLLSANTVKARAWAFMESWDFKNAEPDFLHSQRILESKALESRLEGRIDRLHVQHGLAMIERYQGQSSAALARYRGLTREIAREIRELENRRDDDLPNYAEIRSLLFGRLVNSLQRQADCSLFGDPPDYAEAADDYRRALKECSHLSEDKRDVQRVDLMYGQAVSICLHALGRDSRTASAEIDLARQIYAEADRIKSTSPQLGAKKNLDHRTRLVKSLAAACFQVFDAEARGVGPSDGAALAGKADDAAKPATTASSYLTPDLSRDANTCDRDELERLMFFYKTLIDHRARFRVSPHETLQHVDQLLAYCRSACRQDTPDPDLLAYLRPYHDSAFVAQAEMFPGGAKELIEIAWEATRGTPYLKPDEIQPLLVAYVARGKCHLLLDAPGGISRVFALEGAVNEPRLLEASATGEFETLPDEVRASIREIQRKRPDSNIVLRWRDPVLGIGYEHGTGMSLARTAFKQNPVADHSAGRPAYTSTLLPKTVLEFPFNLKGVLPRGNVVEDVAGLEFRKTRSRAVAESNSPPAKISTK